MDIRDITTTVLTSRTYHVKDGRITGFIDGVQAIEQAVDKLLNTERFAWSIYTSDYGVELERFLGEPYDFAVSDLERTITAALKVDTRIEEVKNFNVERVSKDTLKCYFEVKTVEGIFNIERAVNVE